MRKTHIPYQFHAYEPGVFVEIYVPKKMGYHGRLCDVLTDGFNFAMVKGHFLNEEKKEKIYRMLERYIETKNIEKRISEVEPFYWGYSMYEVDGVFFDPSKGKVEEKTQVIRIMFLPDLSAINKLVPEMEYGDLRTAVKRILMADRDDRRRLREQHPQVVDFISKWKGDVGLFLFGYVILELWSRIKAVTDDAGGELEDEIWLTSFWNLEVNQVSLVNGLNRSALQENLLPYVAH